MASQPSTVWYVLSAIGATVLGGVLYFSGPVATTALDVKETNGVVPAVSEANYVRYFTSNGNLWLELPNTFCQQVGK